jgi:hypothetical protein
VSGATMSPSTCHTPPNARFMPRQSSSPHTAAATTAATAATLSYTLSGQRRHSAPSITQVQTTAGPTAAAPSSLSATWRRRNTTVTTSAVQGFIDDLSASGSGTGSSGVTTGSRGWRDEGGAGGLRALCVQLSQLVQVKRHWWVT